MFQKAVCTVVFQLPKSSG